MPAHPLLHIADAIAVAERYGSRVKSLSIILDAVSYTHLDVYKRQAIYTPHIGTQEGVRRHRGICRAASHLFKNLLTK